MHCLDWPEGHQTSGQTVHLVFREFVSGETDAKTERQNKAGESRSPSLTWVGFISSVESQINKDLIPFPGREFLLPDCL